MAYDYLDRPWKHERLRLAFSKLNTQPLVTLIQGYDSPWIVSTHFLRAEIVAGLKGRKRPSPGGTRRRVA